MEKVFEFVLRREKIDYFNALSYFQKSIREGKTNPALYWAYEVTNDIQGTSAVLNKMRTECCEDIGLANPESIVVINELLQQYRNQPDDKYWISGITYLCNSNKNREVDWYLIAVKKIMIRKQGFKPSKYKNLQEAIDNKEESEAFYYAYELSDTKKNTDKLWDILMGYRNDQVIQALKNTHYSVNKSTRGRDLFWSMALLYIIRQIPWNDIDIAQRTLAILNLSQGVNLSTLNIPTIPDYYNDKHTREGKMLGRGITHWYNHLKPNPLVKVPQEHWEIIIKKNLQLLK